MGEKREKVWWGGGGGEDVEDKCGREEELGGETVEEKRKWEEKR